MALHVGLVVDLSNGFANHYMYTYVLGLWTITMAPLGYGFRNCWGLHS
jgi:hypothetical protein